MKPVKFPGHNIVFGKDQPQYQELPAIAMNDPEGTIITCWELTDDELKRVNETKRIYINIWTFREQLQPILPLVDLADNIDLTVEIL